MLLRHRPAMGYKMSCILNMCWWRIGDTKVPAGQQKLPVMCSVQEAASNPTEMGVCNPKPYPAGRCRSRALGKSWPGCRAAAAPPCSPACARSSPRRAPPAPRLRPQGAHLLVKLKIPSLHAEGMYVKKYSLACMQIPRWPVPRWWSIYLTGFVTGKSFLQCERSRAVASSHRPLRAPRAAALRPAGGSGPPGVR